MEDFHDLDSLWENISEFNERFERSEVIPQSLDNYLLSVAKTGNIIFPWDHVKFLFRRKLVLAVREFGDEKCIDEEVGILDRFENFSGAPFTIQRLTELILEPRRHYSRKEKYLRALEKCVRVSSTVQGVSVQSHLKEEIKMEGDEIENYEEGVGEEELDDSWITDDSYLEDEEDAPTTKTIQAQQVAVGKKLNHAEFFYFYISGMDDHGDRLVLPIIKSKKGIRHPGSLNGYCGKTSSPSEEKLPSNPNTKNPRSPATHKCPFCPLTLKTQIVLKWHIHDDHPNGKKPKQSGNHTAENCDNLFCCGESSGGFQWKHSGEKIYNCKICAKSFGTELGFKWHMESHPRNTKSSKTASDHSSSKATHKKSEDGKFGCSFCDKTFKKSTDLKRHERIHTGEKPFGCSECGKTFARKSTLTTHMKIHTGEKPFGCSLCGKTFTRQHDLEYHSRTHTGEKPFVCSVCGKGFTQSTNLKTHSRTHTGEKPYPCSVCGKGFTQSINLKTHFRTHTREKPYSCCVCRKRFSDSSNFNRHKKTHK